MSELDKVNRAFEELEDAVAVFQQAILKFRGVYEPEAVGLGELSDSLDDIMFEISEDITENLE